MLTDHFYSDIQVLIHVTNFLFSGSSTPTLLAVVGGRQTKNIARHKIFMDSTDHTEKTLLNNVFLTWKY